MNASPNLATLPPEIIKQIILEAEDSVNDLRLISPSWNDNVLSHFASTGLGTLERVNIYAGFSDDDDDQEKGKDIWKRMRKVQTRVQMVAILPERHAKTVGVGEWLSVFKKQKKRVILASALDAIEVASAPQECKVAKEAKPVKEKPGRFEQTQEADEEEQIEHPEDNDSEMIEDEENSIEEEYHRHRWTSVDVLRLLFAAAFAVTTIIICRYTIDGIMLAAIGGLLIYIASGEFANRKKDEFDEMLVSHGLLSNRDKPERNGLSLMCPRIPRKGVETKQFPRVSRFISMFSRLQTLVLEDLVKYGEVINEMVDAIESTLGGVRIDRLEVADYNIPDGMQNRIIELCRKHGIQHVFITAHKISMRNFQDFILQLTSLNVTVDLYERGCKSHLLYFKKSIPFWDKMTNELREQGISLRMITMHDPFWTLYDQQLRAHICCAKTNANSSQPLRPVDSPRGFTLRAYN